MADPHIQQSVVWLGGYDLSADIRAIDIKAARVPIPDARLVDDIDATFPGISQVAVMLEGFYAAGVAGTDSTITNARIITKDATAWPLTICPPTAGLAAGADGGLAYNLRSAQFGATFGGEHGQSLPFALRSRARAGLLDRGTVLLSKATRSVTTTGAAYQLGAVSAARYLVTVLHVFAVTGGGTWTLTIESDNAGGFGSPTVVQTFTGATGITREIVATAGPITDDYFRAVLTKSGGTSCSAAVASFISGQ